MYICVQSACGYFSSSISRVRTICCVGICCSAGSRPGTSRKMVALRSSWFQSLLQRRFSSLFYGSRLPLCVLLRSLAKWLRLCLFSLFWLEQPGCCEADDQVVSGSPPSGSELYMFFGVPGAPCLLPSPSPRWALFSWHQQWLVVRHFRLSPACSCWHLKRWPRRLWHIP